MPCLMRALCASCAPCTRGLGLETTARALALALALCVSCIPATALPLPQRLRRRTPLCRSCRCSFLLLFACVVPCELFHGIPVRWSSVFTTRRRHSRVIFPLCVHNFCLLCLFVCDDLDSIRPHQSSSSLRRGQRRAERMSCPPAGPEGPSLLVFVCMLCSRSSPLREFLRAPAVSGVLTVFMDLSDSPTCRNQSATFGTLLGASTLSPVRAFLATNDSFVAISGCLFYTQTATL